MTEIPERVATLEGEFRGFKEQLIDIKKIIYVGLAGIISLWGAFGFVFVQISDLRAKMDVIEDRGKETLAAVKAIQQALGQLQVDVGTIKGQFKIDGGRTDLRKVLNVPLLDDSERLLIATSIPSPSSTAPAADQLTIGDVVPDPRALNPIPDTLVRRIPQLQGTSYILGKTAIYFVAPPEYRVIAVVHRQ
jgi:hypothetical protein